MVNKKKRYIGTISDEHFAARTYDKAAIQNHGMRANTNFDYTKREVIAILNEPQLLRDAKSGQKFELGNERSSFTSSEFAQNNPVYFWTLLFGTFWVHFL